LAIQDIGFEEMTFENLDIKKTRFQKISIWENGHLGEKTGKLVFGKMYVQGKKNWQIGVQGKKNGKTYFGRFKSRFSAVTIEKNFIISKMIFEKFHLKLLYITRNCSLSMLNIVVNINFIQILQKTKVV